MPTLSHRGVMEPQISTPRRFRIYKKCGRMSVQRAGCCTWVWSGSDTFWFLGNSALTHILQFGRVQYTAHADATRNVSQEPWDQAGAPRAGVGLQPTAPAANPDGTDGTDTTLHRG